MRLIDADMLKKYLLDNGKETERFLQYVDEQPTTYDVDKVVEQLEEIKEVMTSPVSTDCFGGECEYQDCTVCIISRAIEAVKGGGIE